MTSQFWLWLQAFLATENGLKTAWIFIVLGVADALFGALWWLNAKKQRSYLEQDLPKPRHWLPVFLALDAGIISMGLYGLCVHDVFS
jgi:H+/Cl- antiporter ClcA